MMDYLEYLKTIQKEELSIRGELQRRKERLEETKKLFNEVNSFKEDFKTTARKEKEENYKLFQRGIKNCLVCGHKAKEENIKIGLFKLYSNCPNCHTRCWLVGETYPCEICDRICITPFMHHVDGNRSNDQYENLIFICHDCHTAIHSGIGRSSSRIGKQGGKGKRRTFYNEQMTRLIREYSLKYHEGIKNIKEMGE